MISAASAAEGSTSGSEQLPLLAAVVPLVPAWSVDRPFDYFVPVELVDRCEIGTLVRVPFGGRKVRGIIVELRRARPDRELEAIGSVSLGAPVAPPPMPELYRWIAARYLVPQARAFEKAVPPRVRVKDVAVSPVLAQAAAVRLPTYEGGSALLEAISSGAAGTWSLRPLSTDPRGELIAELVGAVGPEGAALVLVPEVRFGSLVLNDVARKHPGLARLDSSQEDMDRAVGWMQMAKGHPLGAGGRGAVFAPAPRLRLLVVDEEHDSTYKEDRSPRYDARRVAIKRARLQGAVCVLVSATPSLGAEANTAEAEVMRVVPARAPLRAARPVVELVRVPHDGGLSPELHARARDLLRAGHSVALLAPATGYARSLWCATCRRSVRCPRCEAGMSYERRETRVRCPRCRLVSRPPDVCPSCGSIELRLLGRGSERYAEQLRKAFPRTPLVHMDALGPDASAGRTWQGSGIYVTTWFGTKPELRPDVSLVGVLDADTLIRRPDFKAAEQAHQALAEMAAWAGPASQGGRLVIQTNEPSHHAVQAVVRGDHDYFVQRELEHRKELDYPPFKELVRVSIAGAAAEDLIRSIAQLVRQVPARVLGPIDAPFPSGSRGEGGPSARLMGRQLLVKCDSAQKVAGVLRDILPGVPRNTRVRVDVDPR